MRNLRRLPLVLAVVTAAFSGCGRAEHAGLSPDIRRELEAGEQAIAGWIAESRDGGVPSDEAVIGLGYAERLRLGLGSPFRLTESALRDPRLSEEAKRDVAWGLLARTLAGEAYAVDPIALDRAGVAGTANWPGLGRHHLNIIESAIHESRDPRSGELAVRLAYRLALMEGSLPTQAPVLASRVAALIRDRELARADVARLLRSAEAVHGDPLGAIGRWRSERWLSVEAPALQPVPGSVEREALDLTPRIAQALRMLRPRLGDLEQVTPRAADVNPSLLTPAVARRLAAIADSMDMPPLAPIAIATRTYGAELLQQPPISAAETERREAFTRTGSEERLVARYALLDRRSPHDAVPSLSVVWAAVALRTHAQEPVWFPGFGGPSNRELEERFGLDAVRFSDAVAAEWRPYYRRAVELALQDMQRVLPALDVRGLSIRFDAAPRGATTLALHDPRKRELLLPPASSAGTIAHEVAHDLDWQVALRQYRVRGDYATDRATRNSGDRLAARVRSLASSAAMDPTLDARSSAHAQRPAENFARAVDWFVASALAAQGRTNGFLTSVQDDVLTGYGTVRSPDITGRAGTAIVNILDEVAPLYPETRTWFLKRYGTARDLSALDLVRSMDELPLPRSEEPTGAPASVASASIGAAFAAIEDARRRGFVAVDEWVCRAPGGAREGELEHGRRRLVAEAAAARARGVALDQARQLVGDEGASWVARQLYGGPWPAQGLDEGLEALLGELVAEARTAGVIEDQGPVVSFELLAPPGTCTTF